MYTLQRQDWYTWTVLRDGRATTLEAGIYYDRPCTWFVRTMDRRQVVAEGTVANWCVEDAAKDAILAWLND